MLYENNRFVTLMVLLACAVVQVLASDSTTFGTDASIDVLLHCDKGLLITPPVIPGRSWWSIQMTLQTTHSDEDFLCHTAYERTKAQLREILEFNSKGIEHTVVVTEGDAGPFSIAFDLHTQGINTVTLTDEGLSFEFSTGLGEFTYNKLEVFDANQKCLASRMRLDGDVLYLDILEAGVYPITIDPLLAVEFPEGEAYFESENTLELGTPNSAIQNTQQDYEDILNNGAMFGWKVGLAALASVRTAGKHDIVVGAPQYRATPNSDDNDKLFLGTTDKPFEPLIHQIGQLLVYKNTGVQTAHEFSNGVTVQLTGFGLPTNHAPATYNSCNSPRFGLDFAVGARTSGYKMPAAGYDEVWGGSLYCKAYLQMTGKSGGPDTTINNAFDQRIWSAGITTDRLLHGVYYRHNDGKTGGTSEMCHAYLPVASGQTTFESICYEASDIQDTLFNVFKLGGAIATHPLLGKYWVVSDYEKGFGRTGEVWLAYVSKPSTGEMEFVWTAVGDQFNSGFGKSLALADVNNDGAPDLLVGDVVWSGSILETGRVHIFFGRIDKSHPVFSDKPNQVIEGKLVNGQFGSSIANLHDINNDGYDDVAISAPYADSGKGRVYVYLGGVSGLTLHQTIKGAQNGELFGFSISEGKDLNNDGVPDTVIGAPGYTFDGVSFGGRAAIMYGLKYSDVTIESASSHNPALASTQLTTTFTIRNNGPETTPQNSIVTVTVPDKALYGSTVKYNNADCAQTTTTSFQCTIVAVVRGASTGIVVTLPFNVNPNVNPQDAALSFKAVLSKKGCILSDVTSELQVPMINQVDLQFVTSATDTKDYAAPDSGDLTVGTMPACASDGAVACSVVADDIILFRGPKIINNGPMDAFGVVMTITHPPDIYYSGDEDCSAGCVATPSVKDYSCTASGAGVTKCVIQIPIVNTGTAMAPFEGRHLKFIIPVATSLDSFRFRMSLNTVSTLTTASLPVTTNSLTRGKAQSSVGLSSQSLDTPAGCVGGIYAGNKFVASMEVLNTAQYSSSKTVVYLELEASSPYTLPNGAPQITLQKADGAFSGSFCTDADGKQLNWVCAVPSGGFVSGNSKDKAIVSLNGKVDAAASGIMDEFVRFIIRVGTSTSQKPGAILPVEQEIEFPLCVQSNFQQTFKIEEKTTPRSMPDNSMIYPHANLALYRTLLLINTGPSHKATDFYTNIAIDTDNESWGDTLPAGCVQQSESIVHCTTGPMKANDPSDFAYWRLPTVLKHANVITSKVATTTAQATPEGGTTSFASFGIYYGVDISLSANGITDIPLGSKATFILATTNRHPSTDATDLNITWAFPANLELQYDELAFSGYTVNPVCETFMSNDTNSDNLIPMLTCIGTQPAGSSTRVRIPATAKNANAETDVAAVGLVATARVLSMNEPDTPADRLTRAKSVTWNFATTSFANVEVTLIPDYSVVDPDTGVHMFALDQTVQMQATIRDIGSLATTGLVATLEWDDNMRLRSNTKRKCATGAVTTNTTWTCDYRSIDQTDRFLENSFTFDYFVDPAVNDTFEVYWRVQSDNDRIPINDGASIDGQISEPVVDLKVSAQINPKTLLPNQPFTMTILCQNQGPSAAANVTLETSNWPSLWMDMIQIPEDCTVVNSQIECDMPILVRGGASVSYTFNGTSKPEIANELNDFVERTVWKLNEGTIASNGDFKNRALYFIYTNFQPKETEVPNNSKTTNTIAAVAGATAIYLAASGIFMLYHAHFFARHPPPETFVEPDVGEL